MPKRAIPLELEQRAHCVLGRALPLVTHELANSANSVIGYADLVCAAQEPQKRAEFSQKLNENAESMRRLITVLRSFSTDSACDPEAGIALEQLAGELVFLVEKLARRRKIEVVVQLQPCCRDSRMNATVRFSLLLILDAVLRSGCAANKTLLLTFSELDNARRKVVPLPEAELAEQMNAACGFLKAERCKAVVEHFPKGLALHIFLTGRKLATEKQLHSKLAR